MATRELTAVAAVRRWATVIAAAGTLAFAASAHADILIKNVTLYDGTGAPAVKGANILVKGERIAQVSTKPIDAGSAKVIDGTGKFVMPGIMDSHVHVKGGQGGPVFAGNDRTPINDRATSDPTLLGFIYSGVTSIYDSGNNEPFIFPLRDDERSGKIVSPRLFVAGGVISVPGGYAAGPTALKATTWEETKAGLDAKFAKKPDMLKMIRSDTGPNVAKPVPTLSDEMFKKITDYAKAHGYRATVHATSVEASTAAVLNGVSALAHPVLREPLTDDFVKLLVDRKIPVSTTTVGYLTIGKLQDEGGMSYLDDRLFKATMSEEMLANAKGAERDDYIKFNMPATFKKGEPTARANIKRLYDAGVVLTSGTDKGYGPYTHMELAFLNQAGVSAFDLIKVATLNGAIYIGRQKDLGSVQPGKYADLLVLHADPGANVKNFQAIDEVIKNGQRIDLAALDLPANHRKP